MDQDLTPEQNEVTEQIARWARQRREIDPAREPEFLAAESGMCEHYRRWGLELVMEQTSYQAMAALFLFRDVALAALDEGAVSLDTFEAIDNYVEHTGMALCHIQSLLPPESEEVPNGNSPT